MFRTTKTSNEVVGAQLSSESKLNEVIYDWVVTSFAPVSSAASLEGVVSLDFRNAYGSIFLQLLDSEAIVDKNIFDDLHSQLIKLAKGMGYQDVDEVGMCYGIATMGMLAALAGEADVFNRRMLSLAGLLYTHKNNIEAVLTSIADEEYVQDIHSVVDGMHLVHNSYKDRFVDLFESEKQPRYQNDPKAFETLFSIITSKKLESLGGISHIDFLLGCYDQSEFINYLNTLKAAFHHSGSQDPIAISLNSERHSISLVYDAKGWLFIDANSLPITRITEEEDLAGLVFNAFTKTSEGSGELAQRIILSSNIFALKAHSEAIRTAIETEYLNPQFQENYRITPEKQQFISSHQENLLLRGIKSESKYWTQWLLNCGANPNVLTKKGDSCLAVAIELGNIELVQLLLEYNADPNAGDPTPLWHAVMQGDVRAMKCLLESGADSNTLFEEDTLLGLAVQRGEIQSVKLLLQYGADLDKLSSRQTLLEIARDTQDIQMIQFLTCLLEADDEEVNYLKD